MARARIQGRKRLASGKLAKLPREVQEAQTMEVALNKRIECAGMPPLSAVSNDQKVALIREFRDPDYGTPLGRLCKAKKIDAVQLRAGDEYGRIRRAYLPYSSEQRPTPTSSSDVMSGGGRTLREEDPEVIKRLRRRHEEMLAVVEGVELRGLLSPRELLDRVLVREQEIAFTIDNIMAVEAVLEALAWHFGYRGR